MSGAISGMGCSPVADPARVAARALAGDVVAGMPIATRRAPVAAALAVEAGSARLVTLGAVPAGLACQAAALGHRAWLLALALAASGEAGEARQGPESPPPAPFGGPPFLRLP